MLIEKLQHCLGERELISQLSASTQTSQGAAIIIAACYIKLVHQEVALGAKRVGIPRAEVH